MKFSEQLLKNIGSDVIACIMDNINKGVDIEGNNFAYSEKNYYRPFDKSIYSKLRKDQSFGKVISNKEGKLGFVIFGYKKFKEVFNPSAKNDYLTWSGKMLRDLNVLKLTDNTVVVGFTDPNNAQKAYWFNIAGVSKSRKLWKFLGLRQQQIDEIKLKYEKQITNEVAVELIKQLLNKKPE
ncbi:MAG: hypothetical protein NZM09_10145 [Ignavibacterium sp.]|nr:hypothetical protein [Ignavibacterium sp.]MDW8376039.1 hypothetical protein [Ignavibacteriales bacterium]